MGASEPWAFGLVGEVIERSWIVWVLKRMNGAVEEKVGSGFVPLASLRSFTYSCVCTAQVMDRATGGYRMPDAAARAPRGDGLDEHGNRWSVRAPRSCCSAPAATRLQWPSPRRRARWPARVQGWHTVAHVPSLQRTPRVRSDADAGKVGQIKG